MDTRILIAIIVAAFALFIVAAIIITRQRKRKHLKQQFGPEYNRAVEQHGDARHAEAVLIGREKRVETYALRPLPRSDREKYAEDWAAIQRRFVDETALDGGP